VRTSEHTDGFIVRPVRTADRQALADAYARLSDESRYMRFLPHRESLTDAELRYLIDVDHHHHEALVALQGDRIVGVCEYVREPGRPSVRHVSIVVAEDWRRRGVADELLSELCERARRAGIRRLEGWALPHNRAALELVRGRRGTLAAEHGSAVRVELDLTEQALAC
jgi:RimJ/RimL family protein N-acetyltransferase